MDKTKYILLSAVIVCIVSQTFCGIGLSELFCKNQERVAEEDRMQIEGQNIIEAKRKKRSYAWLICGLIISLTWIISTIIISKKM